MLTPLSADAEVDAKKALRRACRTRRRTLAAEQPDAATRAAEVLAAVLPLAGVRVAAVYHPVGAELDAGPVARVLQVQDVAIALPVVLAADASLVFRLRQDLVLVPDAAGLLSAPPSAPLVRPDLVIVPLLAFDDHGGRLGQGGGFYDRTLAHLRAEGQVLALGLAYAGQQVERLPVGRHDQPLDGVLTEAGLTWFTKEI